MATKVLTRCTGETFVVQVDQEDAHLLNRNMYIDSHGYVWWKENGKAVSLHRKIMGCEAGDGSIVDHRLRCPTDNRRSNLRFVTVQQNNLNSTKRKNTSSKFKGVYFNQRRGKFVAQVQSKTGRRTYLGIFVEEKQAAVAYNAYMEEHYGTYYVPNDAIWFESFDCQHVQK